MFKSGKQLDIQNGVESTGATNSSNPSYTTPDCCTFDAFQTFTLTCHRDLDTWTNAR
ncbi:hypothetical protein DPMN_000285 [Dreissena polymorpha]|uniref:Uncharacterized protein n=1 Tax=Dreissena polymorpha TaxID=45954 RepID=A0A9D4MH31_DREPO|nr:hypothetical protein DPMN_000285 [Dreissena polymorpha]